MMGMTKVSKELVFTVTSVLITTKTRTLRFCRLHEVHASSCEGLIKYLIVTHDPSKCGHVF